MNQTIWYFDASYNWPTGPQTSRLVFLTEGDAIAVRAQYIDGGYTVGTIGTEIRWVDPITGTIGGTPAATQPVITATTGPTPLPTNPPSAGVWAGGSAANPMYRFILANQTGTYDTGANLAGCSKATPNVCDPRQFGSLYDAVQYAVRRGEVPYLAANEDEVWAIIGGVIAASPQQIVNPGSVAPPGGTPQNVPANAPLGDNTMLYVGAAVLALFLLK